MSTGGFSNARLARMHDTMAGFVERGEVPGLVTVLSRRGETHVDAIGAKALGEQNTMRRDTIFRITSMTKPVTAVAAMILVEECALRLDEPLDRLLPELADRKVLKDPDGPLDETEPARRPLTLRDLLTFRMGYGASFGKPGTPFQKAVAERDVVGFGMPKPGVDYGTDEWLRRLGELPLQYQPGERWQYNTGAYVAGALVERATGKSFPDFLRERIFEPLGMKDTAFFVPPEKLDRLATSYLADDASGGLKLLDAVDGDWSRPPAFADGGAGLVSTADDYLVFARMLMNGGYYGSARILSRPSVAAMTTDQLTPEQKKVSGFVPGYFDALGWGFGVSVVTARDAGPSTPGRYGWDGGYGTTWANDPAEDMVSILMAQRAQFPLVSRLWQDFWTSAYQTIDD